MRAILDTNILLANLRGTRPSNNLKLLLAEARSERYTLVVPQLVIEETVNKRREAAQKAERSMRKAQSDLAAIGANLDLPDVDVNAIVDGFRATLITLLTDAKAELPDLPEVGHDSLVRRALERRKPFTEKGAGYRDALLWETVLEAAGSDTDIVFVTKNTHDFAQDHEGTDLAGDLMEDLARIDATDRVRLLPDLDAFKTKYVAAETIAEDELDDALNQESSPLREEFFERMAEQLRSHVFDRDDLSRRKADWDWDHLDLPHGTQDADLEGATVDAVENLYTVWVYWPRVLGNSVLFEFEAEVDARVELELDVVVEGEPIDPDEPWHREQLRRTVHVHTGETLLIGGEANFRTDVRSVDELSIHHVSV